VQCIKVPGLSDYPNSYTVARNMILIYLVKVKRNTSEDDLFNDICLVVDELIGSVSITDPWPLLDVEVANNGRQENLPSGNIVSIYG